MSGDFSSKCRTCLSDSNFFHRLFDYVDENYKILEILNEIVPQINIKCNAEFSTLICQPCVDKLLTGYKFQQLCIETNNRLHDLLEIAVFVREAKLENVSDPLTVERNLKLEQEIENDVFYEQEINLNELDMSIRSSNDGDGKDDNETRVCVKEEYEKPTQIFKESMQESETNGELFNNSSQYSDDELDKDLFVKPVKSTKDVDTIGIGIAKIKDGNFKGNREMHDNKLVYKHNEVDPSSKVDKIDTPETENNPTNKPRVCSKKELEITSQILKEPMNEFEENCELFSNDSEYSNDESEENLFAKPVKTTKDVASEDTGIAKIKKKKDNFPCEVCGKVFNRNFNLKRHIAVHYENVPNVDSDTEMGEVEKSRSYSGNYTCEVCGRIFAQAFVFKRHKLVHSPSRPHECEICKYRFVTATALKSHLFQHKNGTFESWKSFSRPEGYKCPDCPRRFEKRTSLSLHRRKHNYYSNYPCIVCQKFFTTLRMLIVHVVDKHPELKERYKCDQCGKYFVLHALLVEHLNRHKGNNNVVCLLCEEEFGSADDLTEHMRTHSSYANTSIDQKRKPSDEEVHLCPHCGKTFSKDLYLQNHLPRHSEIKKYQCSDCPKRFNIKSDLDRHFATHTNAKPHVCDICGSRFTRASSVHKHKLIKHSGERPFKCDQCSLSFAIVYHLKKHMRTHTGEKPYKCKYCDRAYAANGDLNKHLRTHVGENTYMCDQCPMTFKYHIELKQHQSEHYKMAQKLLQQSQQIPDESQQHEIIDNKSI